jgi:transcriptional regulator with XRE-family HTH domain
MTYAQKLIDEYKKVLKLRNDSELAEALGVSRACVSRWRSGLGYPEPRLAWEMAEAIGQSPGEVMMNIEAERATKLKNSRAWVQVRNLYAKTCLPKQIRQKKQYIRDRLGLQPSTTRT